MVGRPAKAAFVEARASLSGPRIETRQNAAASRPAIRFGLLWGIAGRSDEALLGQRFQGSRSRHWVALQALRLNLFPPKTSSPRQAFPPPLSASRSWLVVFYRVDHPSQAHLVQGYSRRGATRSKSGYAARGAPTGLP